ncbi:MAG: lyase [Myxococcales bacterium]|nr:lyase [Myxococcales bacterium]
MSSESDSSASTSTSTSGSTTAVDTDATSSTTAPAGFCGDGVVDPGEECDDGNNANGDGCQSNCTLPCTPGGGGMMGDIEKSFLWVANTNEGSISKIDTQAVKELARYRSGPSGGTESPSRTAVSIDGRFVVVNNRGTGRVTAIAANVEDCKDANNDGMITTSQNLGDLLAWGADECVVWSVVLPIQGSIGSGPRGVSWVPGDWNDDPDVCAFENPKVWVGYLPNQAQTAHMVRLNGATGAVEETVSIGSWLLGWNNYGPYGAAIDKEANVWFTGLRGEVFRINASENPITFDRWAPPQNLQFYGMTVDPEGDPWFGGCSGPVSTFNPETQQFTAVAGTQACYRGLAADQDGNVWVASNGPCGVVQIDYKTNTLIKFHQPAQCSTPVGVSVDIEGYVWVVDQAGWAWKIDPQNPDVANWINLPVAGNHYTYSDMTGGQAKSVILPQ